MNSLFKDAKKEEEFINVKVDIQEYLSTNYTKLVSVTDSSKKERIINLIRKYLEDNRLNVKGLDRETAIIKLYQAMAEYDFLTDYLYDNSIEEININRWDDVKLHLDDGSVVRSKEGFRSPEHALDVIKKLLNASGSYIDTSKPTEVGHLFNNIRITAYQYPVIDKDAGVSVSIRKVNPKNFLKEDFIKFGTGSEKMIAFLVLISNYGISQLLSGATNSGKTTLLGLLLKSIDNDSRIITIENGTREFDLVKRDEDGNVINNVIHLITRTSKDSKFEITQEKLLELSLTSNPDVICLAEAKSGEAFAVQEAARTGHTVLTTVHANSALGTYLRMATLCKMKYDIDFKMLYDLVTEAFPISIYIRKQKGTGRRIITEISEMEITKDGERKNRTLFTYVPEEDSFKQVNSISDSLRARLINNFAPSKEVERF